MRTPVDFDKEIGAENDNSSQQARTLGWLAVVYGIFLGFLIFIPNPPDGRIAIACCSLIMLGIGAFLIYKGRNMQKFRSESE